MSNKQVEFDFASVCTTANKDIPKVALVGNPNVGKSTIFNAITNLNQHTGNWPGKTVSSAFGTYKWNNKTHIMVDLPGTYSLNSNSYEEEIARDFICFGKPDAVVVVCDATCLERNLILFLQTLELHSHVILCINLMDEARSKGILVEDKKLHDILGVPVVCCCARDGAGIETLLQTIEECQSTPLSPQYQIQYPKNIEAYIQDILPRLPETGFDKRWLSLRLIDQKKSFFQAMYENTGYNFYSDFWQTYIHSHTDETFEKNIVSGIVLNAEDICNQTVSFQTQNPSSRDRKIDKFFISKKTGIPVMIGLLLLVFYITIVGANYPSSLLQSFFYYAETKLLLFFEHAQVAEWFYVPLVSGVFRVTGWVIAVMLPPMAIFFPLFTILEDSGYLPRIAFNLDCAFKKAGACGKQALTHCMGFGCNAVGITGCRIIDSPRERLIAMITNVFAPCNGRLPTAISIITMFFLLSAGAGYSFLSAVILTLWIILGIFMTFLVSKFLSSTLFKGIPSSFALELPPYRKPQFLKVIVRSILDRTLFVLARAAAVAAPAGLIIWLLSNLYIGDASILSSIAAFLDPFGRLIGLDGVILIAFLLSFPANEILFPLIIMGYLSTGMLTEFDKLSDLKALLVTNGWTTLTAICVLLFSLMHWPCSTSCITIYKETKSLRWTAVAIAIPTIAGIGLCFFVASVGRLLF